MPARRQVEALKQLCMPMIAKNLSMYSSTELQDLSWDLSEELLQFLDHDVETYICLTDRNRLIKPNATKLTLIFPLYWDQFCKDNLSIIWKFSKNLTHLTCNGNGTFTREDWVSLVCSIPNITALKFTSKEKKCQVNDDILEAIGNNCPKIESLTLMSREITDAGIRRLCQSRSGGSNIKYLKFHPWCCVSEEGCLLALNNLKQLNVFDCGCMNSAIVKMYEDCNGLAIPALQLCQIPDLVLDPERNETLDIISQCCPNLHTLRVLIKEEHAKCLDQLNKWKSVVPFSLWFNGDEIVTADWVNFGPRLTNLELYGTKADLNLIGFICPNLKELSLRCREFITPLTSAESDYVVPFSQLQRLHLEFGGMHSPTSMPRLGFLFDDCLNLEELSLEFIFYSLPLITDDEIFNAICEMVPIYRLTHYSLRHCYRTSKLLIYKLLDAQTNLKFMKVEGCLKILASDLRDMQSYIKQNNLSVSTCFPELKDV